MPGVDIVAYSESNYNWLAPPKNCMLILTLARIYSFLELVCALGGGSFLVKLSRPLLDAGRLIGVLNDDGCDNFSPPLIPPSFFLFGMASGTLNS